MSGWDGQQGREQAERAPLAMARQQDNPIIRISVMLRTPCHAERSEASRRPPMETLRGVYPERSAWAQGDKQRHSPSTTNKLCSYTQPPSPSAILNLCLRLMPLVAQINTPLRITRKDGEPGGAGMIHQQLHQPGMSVHPATSTVPVLVCVKAKAVVLPPLSSPKTRVVIGSLLCILVTCKAYILPSNLCIISHCKMLLDPLSRTGCKTSNERPLVRTKPGRFSSRSILGHALRTRCCGNGDVTTLITENPLDQSLTPRGYPEGFQWR